MYSPVIHHSSTVVPPVPEQPENRLLGHLDSMTEAERASMRRINLKRGQVIQDAGARDYEVFFPVSAVLSVIASPENGQAVEVVSIGKEGMTGVPEVWTGGPASTRVEVLFQGEAVTMGIGAFRRLAERQPAFNRAALIYAGDMFRMITRASACYRHHSVREQCARWLLVARDRLGSDVLPVTHDGMADLLGVCRPTISFALHELKEEGLISLSRGRISILDYVRLAANACTCFRQEGS